MIAKLLGKALGRVAHYVETKGPEVEAKLDKAMEVFWDEAEKEYDRLEAKKK